MAKTVACALVGSRLNYANSFLYAVSDANIHKLQRMQNTIAWVVTFSRSNTGVMDILKDLHWLPVRFCIALKSRHWCLRCSWSTFRHSSQTTPWSEICVQLELTFCTLLVLRHPLVRVLSRRRRKKFRTLYQLTSENAPHWWLFTKNSRLFIWIKPSIT